MSDFVFSMSVFPRGPWECNDCKNGLHRRSRKRLQRKGKLVSLCETVSLISSESRDCLSDQQVSRDCLADQQESRDFVICKSPETVFLISKSTETVFLISKYPETVLLISKSPETL